MRGQTKRLRSEDDDDTARVEFVDLAHVVVTGVRDSMLLLNHHAKVRGGPSSLLGKNVRLFNVKRSSSSGLLSITPGSHIVVVEEGEKDAEEEEKTVSKGWSCVMCGFASNFSTKSVCFKCRADRHEGPNSRILWDI